MSKKLDVISFAGSYVRGRLFQIMRHIIYPIFKYKFSRKNYGDKRIMEIDEGTEYLISLINSQRPIMVGRFGTSECRAFVRKLEIDMGIKKSYGDRLDVLCTNAGFFPKNEKIFGSYFDLMADLYSEVDLLCIMNSLGEDFIVKKFCKNAQLTRLEVVDPILTKWTYILEGKKVLVVHPMADTIEKQYNEKQNLIFKGSKILPKFKLLTVKAVQTVGSEKDERFETWFEALDYMTNEIEKMDFDIALIGAGAYGFPLAARVKRMGKQAIHLGGCLQLLFGIIGLRWENNDVVKGYFNSAWTRPSSIEIPKEFKKIENGCYW